MKKRGFRKGFLKTIIIFGIIVECFVENTIAINAANGKSHRFQVAGGAARIEDEGFRWRNTFNFTLNGAVFNPLIWQFNGRGVLNGAGGYVGPLTPPHKI